MISCLRSKKTCCDRQALLMGWRGVREGEETFLGRTEKIMWTNYLSLQVHTRKFMALGLKKSGLGVNSVIGCTYFNEQDTLSFRFLFLHNEELTLVILARPKILRGYFVQLL